MIGEKIRAIRSTKIIFEKIDRIELENIRVHHFLPDAVPGNPDVEKIIFRDLSFKFPTDRNILLDGNMGSGRSTLMKMMAGLIIPNSGSYFLNGHDVTQMSFEEFLPYRLQIGYSFDYGGLLANQSLKNNLLIPLLYHNRISQEEAEYRVEEVIQALKIKGHEHQRPASVSGAMRKATVVARGFVQFPEMLILDDPFVGLDDDHGTSILELIELHRKERGLRHLFFSTRNDRFIQRLDSLRLTLENSQLNYSVARKEKRGA